MVDLLVKAREDGLDITSDVYPYTAAGAGYNQLVPLWAQEGTIADFMARLRDPATRTRIRDEVRAGLGGLTPQWETWYVAFIQSEENRHCVGKNVSEIAEERDVEPSEAVLQLLDEENGSVPTRVHNRVESDVRYFMGHDLAMIGSDGRAVSPYGPYANALPHPRFYGTYPRILGRYVREEPAVLTLGKRHLQDDRFSSAALGHEGPRPREGGADGGSRGLRSRDSDRQLHVGRPAPVP